MIPMLPDMDGRDVTGRDVNGRQDELWLLGQPPLTDYLDVVRRHVIGGDQRRRDQIIDEWRVANDRYAELEDAEAGIADTAECLDLPDAMRSAAIALERQDYFHETFDRVPTRFAMVELDKIVVSQRHVTLPFVQRLAAGIGPNLSDADLFRFCQPMERRDAVVSVKKLGRDRFAFLSESTDLRFHEARLLRPDQVSGCRAIGPISAVVGLVVGHGSNFLSVIRSDDRMVLHNGYHRACAMRMAGLTHAPAIVQTVTRRDELETVAAAAVTDDPAFYFRAKRPPLLKDFFDPRTSVVLPVRRKRRMIELSFTVNEVDLEDA